MRLAAGICSTRDWKPQFGVSLAGLIGAVASRGVKNVELEQFDLIIRANCSNLCNGRQSIIKEAWDRQFTHLLFVDDDMTFPCDLLDHLCRHKVDVVAANASRKAFGSKGNAIAMNNQFLAGPGLHEVQRIGTGVMLINLEAIRKVPLPHFEMLYVEDLGRTVGEDYYFCVKARKHGVKIFVDQDVSRHIGHVGDFEYRLGDDILGRATSDDKKVA